MVESFTIRTELSLMESSSAFTSYEFPSQGKLSNKPHPMTPLNEHMRAADLDLAGSDLSDGIGRSAVLVHCRFDRGLLHRADLSASTLRICSFDGAQGESVTFDGARLEDSS